MSGIEVICQCVTMLTRSSFFIFISVLSVILLFPVSRAEYEDEWNPLNYDAMQFIVEYANWRRLDHIVVFDSYLQKGSIPLNLMQLLDCLSQQGIYTSIYSSNIEQFTPDMFRVTRHRLGVIVLLKCNEELKNNHVINQASYQQLYDEQHSWLIVTCLQNDPLISSTIQRITITLTTDLVIALSINNDTQFIERMGERLNISCPVALQKKNFTSDEFSKEVQVHVQPPKKSSIFPSHKNYINTFLSEQVESVNTDEKLTHSSYISFPFPPKVSYKLTQIYKIVADDNRSIIKTELGSWGPKLHFDKIVQFNSVENRQDLMGFPLRVGYKNWTMGLENAGFTGGKNKGYDTDVNDTDNLLEIIKFIAKSLNATIKLRAYQSVGTEIQEGVWSDLLNDVVKGKVDFGLEKVTVTYNKLDYMAFTHNIMKMSHNLYMHPSEFSVSKDIYLTPFSPKLLLCVLGMAILLALIMLIVSAVVNYRKRKNNLELETVSASYAALWIVGILSMQGSVWTPISSSGNMTLISSLMFALIIYNSYAAFITSILSVKTSDINSLEDLFENGYKVGYIKDSQDEQYLQKQADDLKNIYLRGYNSKVDNIEEGLVLAATAKYALFVSTQAARRAINTLNPYECRCQIQEFVLKSTEEDIAFPLNKSSPYLKVVNLGVLRLIESGTLSRIVGYMMPNMPTCSSDSSFVSAQFEDVLTAVKLLGAGMILSIVIVIGECIIKYRISLRSNIKRGASQMARRVKNTMENFEF